MARLKESYESREVNDLLAGTGPASSDEVSITADGRRLDTAQAVIAFFDELRARRAAPSAGD